MNECVRAARFLDEARNRIGPKAMVQVRVHLADFQGCEPSHAVQERCVGGQMQTCTAIALSNNVLTASHMS